MPARLGYAWKGWRADDGGHRCEPGRRDAQRRAGDRRDELRVLRGQDREDAEQAGRSRRHRQLRHRDRPGVLPGLGQHRRPDLGGGAGRLHRVPGRRAAGRARPGAGGGRRRGGGPGSSRCAAARVSLVLAVPVVVLAMVPALQFRDWQWLSLALASPVAVWGAWPFYRAALASARHGTATMDTLISVGVAAAYLWSLYALLFGAAGQPGMRMSFSWLAGGGGTGATYLEVASGVTALVLLGRYLEARAKRRAGAALRALLSLAARDVAVLRGGTEVRVPAGELAAGEQFVVRPGERIAADGVVVAGSSAVDTSMLTGEPVPAEVGPGDAVTGGCVNVGGRLVVRATRVGADTQLAQMGRLVAEAQAGKAPVRRSPPRWRC